MNPLILIFLVVLAAVVLLVGYSLTTGSKKPGRQTGPSANLRAMVQSQRVERRAAESGGADAALAQERAARGGKDLALSAAKESGLPSKRSTSVLSLEKKLRFAHLPLAPIHFQAIQILATVLLLIPTVLCFGKAIWFAVAFLTPKIVGAGLDFLVNVRFKKFDRDYPVLLMSYVSLLKTGMNTIGGLETAAKGLDPDSLVRQEVEVLMERLRLGLTEEQALGAFGEDIYHPELELFVQSLILSRKVGGTLSATLERLTKQVRKRSQFRKQAVAAIGMEKGSLYAIAAIMSALLVYITFQSPELVLPAFSNPTGRSVLEFGIMLIACGFYWSSVVAKIKV